VKKLIETSSLIGAFLIFNGFLKLYIFYGHWNIKIIDYLDFGEIILSFLNDLNIIILFTVIFLFHQLLGGKAFEFADAKLKGKLAIPDSSNPTILSQQPISDIMNFVFAKKMWIVLLELLVFTIIFSGLFFYTNNRFWLYMAMASFFPLLYIFFDTTMLAAKNLSELIALILTFISFTICLAIYDIKEIPKIALNNIMTIQTDNETVTTSTTNFLLGKTHDFIYLYDNLTNCTRIIPVDKIKNIEGQSIK
jgi:hypothetical protein